MARRHVRAFNNATAVRSVMPVSSSAERWRSAAAFASLSASSLPAIEQCDGIHMILVGRRAFCRRSKTSFTAGRLSAELRDRATTADSQSEQIKTGGSSSNLSTNDAVKPRAVISVSKELHSVENLFRHRRTKRWCTKTGSSVRRLPKPQFLPSHSPKSAV